MKIIFVLFLFLATMLSAEPTGFTQADREMLIRLSEKAELAENRFDQIDKRFEQIENRIQQLEAREDSHFLTLITLFVGLFATLIGFIFWDRRMALVPVNQKVIALETDLQNTNAEYKKLKAMLKDFAEKNVEFKDVYGRAAML